jgi:hypothetical protein
VIQFETFVPGYSIPPHLCHFAWQRETMAGVPRYQDVREELGNRNGLCNGWKIFWRPQGK